MKQVFCLCTVFTNKIFNIKFNLTQLTKTRVSSGLQEVPDNIPPNTIELLLQNNQISQLIPNNFIHLPNLKFVFFLIKLSFYIPILF